MRGSDEDETRPRPAQEGNSVCARASGMESFFFLVLVVFTCRARQQFAHWPQRRLRSLRSLKSFVSPWVKCRSEVFVVWSIKFRKRAWGCVIQWEIHCKTNMLNCTLCLGMEKCKLGTSAVAQCEWAISLFLLKKKDKYCGIILQVDEMLNYMSGFVSCE